MKNLVLSLSLISLIFFSSCDKEDFKALPQCIQDEINSPDRVCPGDKMTVHSFFFQGETVFILTKDQCIADGGVSVVNQNCDTLCFLGGIAGLTTCQGEEFYQVATDEELVWEER